MTDKEKAVAKAEREWEREKRIKEREHALKEEKRVFKNKHKKTISTSKKLIMFLFINCTLIELFTGWVTVKSLLLAETALMTPDFTPLVTLIGAVVSEVIGFAVYALKSAKENSAGGIIFEQAMAEMNAAECEIPPNDENAEG